jgi:hypothetical protein
MKYIFGAIVLNIIFSATTFPQPWQDYPDDKPPKMTLREENEDMKAQMRGFIIGAIVAFIIYQLRKDGFFTAICGGGAFLATYLLGTGAGVIVAILIIVFNVKGQKN